MISIDHSERAHALLGPSGAKRWMTCTPSPRFGEMFEEEESEYAKEGTAGHEYGEILLRNKLWTNGEDKNGEAEAFRGENPYYCGDMEEAVQTYVEFVFQRFLLAQAQDPDAELWIEQRVDYSEWVPEGFGTSDTIIVYNHTLEVIDYKHGQGVPVSAVEDEQTRLYAIGSWNFLRKERQIYNVKTFIVQPRLQSITQDEINIVDLLMWLNRDVVPKAQLAWKGEGKFVPGKHCRFCPGKHRCKALADYNLQMMAWIKTTPNRLTDLQIAQVLKILDTLHFWAKNVKHYALKEAEQGRANYPGYKLVRGRSNSMLLDRNKAIEVLQSYGYKESTFLKKPEPMGLSDMKKLIGPKRLEDMLGNLIIKPPGKPTLVPEEDERSAIGSYQSAIDDFSNL